MYTTRFRGATLSGLCVRSGPTPARQTSHYGTFGERTADGDGSVPLFLKIGGFQTIKARNSVACSDARLRTIRPPIEQPITDGLLQRQHSAEGADGWSGFVARWSSCRRDIPRRSARGGLICAAGYIERNDRNLFARILVREQIPQLASIRTRRVQAGPADRPAPFSSK